MKRYEFDVALNGISQFDDNLAEALFAAGCDDGTPSSRDGVAWIHFDRESHSLEEAIQSAISQVRSVGFLVSKDEIRVSDADESALERLLDSEFHAECDADEPTDVTLEEVRAGLASIPGDLTADFVAERNER